MKNTLFGSLIFGASVLFACPVGAQSDNDSDYEWIRHSRIFIIDGFTYPLSPRIEFDAEKLAQTMVDMHSNVVRIATSGYCDWLIPGTEFNPSPYLGNRDILAECITACKHREIKVVPYLRTGGPIRTSAIKPEWAQKVTPEGEIRSFWDLGEKATACCWNTPYRQAFYDYVATIVSNYDIDGIYFDSWFPFYRFDGSLCYCEGCITGFRKVSGKNIPYKKNYDYTPEELKTIESYRRWYREEFYEVFSETKRIVKSYKDIPMIYNINNPSRIMREDSRILNGSDAFLYERGRSMMERAEGVSLATAHGLAVWPYVGTYDPFPRIPHYKYELEQEIYTSVAFGGSPILYHSYFFTEHPEARSPVKEAFGIFSENDKFIKGFRPEKYCAVIWNNYDPPGHDVEGFMWDTNARLSSLGLFSACITNHIQTTSMLQEDLDDLSLIKKYKVIVLPDICYLTDKQVTTLTKFVEGGGGLVMTYATSLYDENGKRRNDFGLSDLARIRYHMPDENLTDIIHHHLTYGGVWDLYLKTCPGQKVIKPPLTDRLLPTHLYETVDVLPGGSVIAEIVTGYENEAITPGIIAASHGKGKLVYISSSIGALYQQTSIIELADMIRNIIEYVSPESIPYEIEAPASSLISNMTVNGDKRVFHLINHTGSRDERILQNVYYIPPINNVTIQFRIPQGKKIKQIQLFVPSEFTHKRDGNIEYINLEQVDKYQGVVVELE